MAKYKDEDEKRYGYIALSVIALIILLITNLCEGGLSNSTDKIAGTGPSETKAIKNIRVFIKLYYLKDPDSYEGIDWGPSGVYMKENNTYFMMHKYRARNSFGGYVVENPMFILNANGDVIDVKTDINDVINDGY